MVKNLRCRNFSVLISLYSKEEPEHLTDALKSIWDQQDLKPKEIVIVKDGPLTKELDQIILDFSLRAPVKSIILDKNMGLGIALARGVDACTYDIIARMDTDDIAKPDRFEKQLAMMEKHQEYDLVGSNILEFGNSILQQGAIRKVPQYPSQVYSFSKKRNPVNHMTAVFRKKAILEVGNYLSFKGYEDYYLWVRMIQNGSRFYNIQENLVFARTGTDLISRRQGSTVFIQEIKFQRKLFLIAHINLLQFTANIFIRSIPRLFPVWVLKHVYKFLRK